jgi:hypothetical protein
MFTAFGTQASGGSDRSVVGIVKRSSCPGRADPLVRLGGSFEEPCKTMKPFSPKRFLSPLILLTSLACLGTTANFAIEVVAKLWIFVPLPFPAGQSTFPSRTR